jgi:hypothetical protein
MYLISIELYVILHFETALEGLHLGDVLILRCQHDDWDSNMWRIAAFHQRRMNLCSGFKGRVLA